jgi:hypothetical protein
MTFSQEQDRGMPDIEFIRAEIERMRYQVQRQRGEIKQLQRAGLSSTWAEALLDRMPNKIHDLCAERDRVKTEQPGQTTRKSPRRSQRRLNKRAVSPREKTGAVRACR